MSDTIMENGEVVYRVLRAHVGKDQAITAMAAARALGWNTATADRVVRAVIEIHGNTGEWPGTLCATPGMGYYFAATIEEIAEYRKYLETLSKASKSKLRKFDEAAKREGFALEGVIP